MTTLRAIVDELGTAAAAGDATVLCTVVRVVGSSYGGVGTRMLVRVDGTTVGLVSGGCLESDLAEHARRVHAAGRAEVVSYDTRADDDAVWGLGLGCNGVIDVLLEPLTAERARDVATLLTHALDGDRPQVLATVVQSDAASAPTIGAHALLDRGTTQTTGAWGDGRALAALADHLATALGAGRRGLVATVGDCGIAFEVVAPVVRLIVCGSGPDVVPVVQFAVRLGWHVVVVDHRAAEHTQAERFPGARVVSCADASRLGLPLGGRTAAVVMSHHFGRDTDYVQSLLASPVSYIGVLGPRARTERMLAELASRGVAEPSGDRLHAPIGLDLGGDGPDAIALAIVSEISAVMHQRSAMHLRDRRMALHEVKV